MAKLRFKMFLVMAGAMAMKARDYAQENPEKVAETLDSVESTVSSRTGGKYDAKIRKGSSALRKGLGVREAYTSGGTATGGGTVPDTGTATESPLSSTTPPPPPANGRPDRGAGI